jgi:hypothetical protein
VVRTKIHTDQRRLGDYNSADTNKCNVSSAAELRFKRADIRSKKSYQMSIYLFIVYLTTLSVSQNERMIVNNKLERMWKEAAVA